jgi:hypothetical protein
MAAPAKPRPISAILQRAAEIGAELHVPLNSLKAHRLTREAWHAEVLALAGGPEALADAVARVAKRPHLSKHLAGVAKQWAPAASIDGPAAERSVGDFERFVAAATEATVAEIDANAAGAVVGAMVLQDPAAEFGPCDRRGATRDRIAELQAELDRLDVELRGAIPAELVIETGYLRAPDGRLVDWFEPQPATHASNVLALGLQVRRAA